MSTTKSALIDRYFKEGAEVEISSNDKGLLGSWYLGTIIRVKTSSLTAVVEYKTLVDEKDERLPLREKMELVQLRPPQPAEERPKFAVDDYVDAYYHDGWWEGMVTGFFGEDKYVVFFRHTREQRAFKASRLRLHREWVYGKWHPAFEEQRQDVNDAYYMNEVPVKSPEVEVPAFKKRKIQSRDHLYTPSKDVPLTAEMQGVPLSAETPISTENTPNKEQAKHGFIPGQLVEVSSDDEGFEGAWFPATVVQTLNANKYLIEYQSILSNDNKSLLTEKVDSQHMRPCPPEVSIVDRFDILEDVDVFYNDCWWAGAISKVLKDDRYNVYFGTTDEEMKFKHSQLRVHQKWINGRWVIPSKALEL